MATAYATVHLGSSFSMPRRKSGRLLQLILAFEAWQDRRASRRALYRLDDRALADIGLSAADVEGFNEDPALSLKHVLLLPDVSQERV
ncbi:MAG TPA: DUF1127 domain-containing protein [Microvirga sp.]|nr:DUF1127 domain-containing protein [Microvirga sp.]